MTEYLDHIAIARQLLEQQGEINALRERAEKAEQQVQRVRDVLARLDAKFYEDFVIALDGPEAIPPKTGCRTTQHCAYNGWCHRCDPDRAVASREARA